MPRKRPNDDPNQMDLPAAEFKVPRVVTPTVRVPQPDGSILFKAGKPQVVEDEVDTHTFAKEVGMSQRNVQYLCYIGQIKSRRMSHRPRSKHLIPVSEIERYRNINHD